MQHSAFTIRTSGAADSAIYASIMEDAFGYADYERRYTWQYFNELSHSTLFIAESGAEPAGIVGIELRPLTTGAIGGVVIDMAVRTTWRRRGVLRALLDRVEQFAAGRGAEVLTSLPNALGAVALGKVSAWKILGRVPVLRRSTGCGPTEQAMDRAELSKRYEYIGYVRNERYREWRFRRHPHYRYTVEVTGAGAIAVWKRYGTPAACDIVEVDGPPRSLISGYCAALRGGADAGLAEAVTWGLVPAAEYRALERLGWKRHDDQERSLAVNPLHGDAKVYCDLTRWRVQPADIEHY